MKVTKSQFSDRGTFPHGQGGKSLYFGDRFNPAQFQNPSNTKIVKVYTEKAVKTIRKYNKLKKGASIRGAIVPPALLDNEGRLKYGVTRSIVATAPKPKRVKHAKVA